MSDKVKGLVVVFNEDIPLDEAKKIVDAIRLFPHVATIEPSAWSNEDIMNRSRIRKEIEQKLWAAFRSPTT